MFYLSRTRENTDNLLQITMQQVLCNIMRISVYLYLISN